MCLAYVIYLKGKDLWCQKSCFVNDTVLHAFYRSATPINGFMILNRLGLNDMIEPINKHLEFQLQDPFLLYRNGQCEFHIRLVSEYFESASVEYIHFIALQ